MVAPAAVMVNVLGRCDGPAEPRGLAEALAVPGAHVHLYGKRRSRPGRKMGHVTALGPDLASAEATATRAAEAIL
jgi:5-(carboxyamino)imidazole ribonucleotide synthase